MAILTFPFGFSAISLKVDSGLAFVRRRKAVLLTARRSDPVWVGRFSTGDLSPAEFAAAHAFITDAVERHDRIDFVHPRFAVPKAYTLTSWPLAGDAELAAVTDLYNITVSGLEIGTMLAAGDRLAVIQGGITCYRELARPVVVSSAISQALRVTPRLPIGVFAAGAAVRFKNPAVRLAIEPDSYDLDEASQWGSLTIQAVEALS